MKPVFRSNLFALIIIITVIAGSLILGILFSIFNASEGTILFLQEVILLIIPVIIFFIVTKKPIKETLRFNRINILQILLIVGIAIFIQPLAQLIGLFSNLVSKDYVGNAMTSIGSLPMITKLGIMALTPAICEEITFRGVIFSGYKKVDIRLSAVMTGLFFGIFHLNLQQFFYAFALGVLLAYLVYITDSIISSMVLHFFFNGIQLIMAYFAGVMASKINTKVVTSIATLSVQEKLQLITFQMLMVFIFTPVAIFLIFQLRRVSIKRNALRLTSEITSIYETEIKEKTKFKDIINWPVLVMIVLFILFLFYLQLRT